MLNKPEIAYHGVVYTEQFGDAAYVARCRTVCAAQYRLHAVAVQRLSAAAGR